MTTDPDLDDLRAWQAGNTEAGHRLFSRHYHTVYRFFDSKVGSDVDDLVQGTFLTCLHVAQRFEGRSSFRTFLLGIANNKLREWARSRSPDFDPLERSVADLGVSPSTALRERQELRLVQDALCNLPLSQQVLLELYYFERLTAPALAEVLAVPENTVRSRLRKARALLQRSLERAPGNKHEAPTHSLGSKLGLDELLARLRTGDVERPEARPADSATPGPRPV